MSDFIIESLTVWVMLLAFCFWLTATHSRVNGAGVFILAAVPLVVVLAAMSRVILASEMSAFFGAFVAAIVAGAFWYEALRRGGLRSAWRELRAAKCLAIFVPWFALVLVVLRLLEATPPDGVLGAFLEILRVPAIVLLWLVGPFLLFAPLVFWFDKYGRTKSADRDHGELL